jgi:hypothetical protein
MSFTKHTRVWILHTHARIYAQSRY